MKTQILKSILISLSIVGCKGQNEKIDVIETDTIKKNNYSKEMIVAKNDSILNDDLNDKNILNFIYGNYNDKNKEALWKKNTNIRNFNYKSDATLVTTIINSKQFNVDNLTKSIFITKTISLNDDLYPVIGILEFTKKDEKKWKITLNDYFYQSITISGVPIIKMDLIGKKDYGIFLNDVMVSEGLISEKFRLFSNVNNKLKEILLIEDFCENNSGICEDELNNCYNYKTSYEIINSSKNIFNIRFLTKGTKLIENKLNSFEFLKEFEFDEIKKTYIMLNRK